MGFDELGNTDKFTTAQFEIRLSQSCKPAGVSSRCGARSFTHAGSAQAVIDPPDSVKAHAQKAVFGFVKNEEPYNSDDDY